MKITDYVAVPDGLTAAAHRVNTSGGTSSVAGAGVGSRWKSDAWQMYDQVGELRKITNWLGNNLSRVKLYGAEVQDDGQPTATATENMQVARIVADIAGGPAGQAKLLSRLATGLTVVGETWLAVIRRERDGVAREEWHALAAEEIERSGAKIILKLEDGTDHEFNAETDLLTRVHRPHPRNSREADSPVRSAMQPLSEIVRTSAAIEGASKSRLAGNGILALPQEIAMPVVEAPTADSDAPGLPGEPVTVERQVTAQDIMAQLQTVMTTAIADPTSAAALVPIVLKAPGDTLDKIRHITFQSEVTETNLRTREAAILRLARSLDIPPEMLTGVGGTNHWNAWSIDADAIRSHIAPMMTVICDALTEAVLRPLLSVVGVDPSRYVVWFDTTPLTQKQDRSDDAQAAFDAGAINAATYRRELGFTDDDAPPAEMDLQAQRDLAVKIVTGAPSTLPLLAKILGLDLDVPEGGA